MTEPDSASKKHEADKTSTENAGASNSKAGRSVLGIVLVILSIHAILVAWGATRLSPTWDEAGHIPAGVAQWKFGRTDLYRVNPPLPRLLATLPVLWTDFDLEWQFDSPDATPRDQNNTKKALGRQIIEKYGQDSMRYFIPARWMMIPFSLLGGWICFCWGRDLFGPISGLAALMLWCFSPSVLGNAQLLMTDVPAAALAIASSYSFWRWLREPDWDRATTAGLFLGGALLCKLTLVLLLPLWLMIWLVVLLARRPKTWFSNSLQLVAILLISILLTNLVYAFGGTFRPLGDYRFYSEALTCSDDETGPRNENRFRGTWLENLPVPFPAHYVEGFDVQKKYIEKGQRVYVHGKWYDEGKYYYYLYTMMVKWPLGTLVLMGLAAVAFLFFKGYRKPAIDEIMLLLPAIFLLVLISSNIKLNKHIRYALPIFPFLYIWMSRIGLAWPRRNGVLAGIGTIALTGTVIGSLSIYPHSLAYFNVATGGPLQGHRYLAGTSIDWCQDLLYLDRWMEEHPEARPLGVVVKGLYPPEAFEIDSTSVPKGPREEGESRPPEAIGPLPGWYALSVRAIQSDRGHYAYFRQFEPVATAGYSIYIYHISLEEANRARKTMGLPPLSEPPSDRKEPGS